MDFSHEILNGTVHCIQCLDHKRLYDFTFLCGIALTAMSKVLFRFSLRPFVNRLGGRKLNKSCIEFIWLKRKCDFAKAIGIAFQGFQFRISLLQDNCKPCVDHGNEIMMVHPFRGNK